jgi:ABC-type dipeptide/oligopeptide/nickel transport system permease subunit
MASPTYQAPLPHANDRKTLMSGYLFGAPMGELGWFASLLMGLAAGMAAFFFATFLGIMTILFLNAAGHKTDYAYSYLYVGLPVGLTMMVLALGYLGFLWSRRVSRKA